MLEIVSDAGVACDALVIDREGRIIGHAGP
jgi:hypothetical protein